MYNGGEIVVETRRRTGVHEVYDTADPGGFTDMAQFAMTPSSATSRARQRYFLRAESRCAPEEGSKSFLSFLFLFSFFSFSYRLESGRPSS